jgi:hypothetical protein
MHISRNGAIIEEFFSFSIAEFAAYAVYPFCWNQQFHSTTSRSE